MASPERSNPGYVLMTGATGLLGRYLLHDLLARGECVAALVRPSATCSPELRVEEIMQHWENCGRKPASRPVVLHGDVRQQRAGLNEDQFRWVRTHCRRLLHNAAVIQFPRQAASDELRKTNIEGTSNIIQLARQAGIEHLHYISTAYVCGTRPGPVLEGDFDLGQRFRNDYERTKFEAERIVRAADGFQSTTIYRPAVIVGDSHTGFTSTYHGLFVYLRLMALLVPHVKPDANGVRQTPICLPLQGDEPRNLVPVDWVSRVICHLLSKRRAWGQTYHLAPQQGITARQLIEYCYQYFNSAGVQFVGVNGAQRVGDDFATKIFEHTQPYHDYETNDPVFDMSNLQRFASELPCPEIGRETIFRYLKFGQQQNWGKKRKPVPQVNCWASEYVTDIAAAAQQLTRLHGESNGHGNGRCAAIEIGLDIAGPGGGQFQLVCAAGRLRAEPGLPANGTPIIRTTTDEVASIAHRGNRATDPWVEVLQAWLANQCGIVTRSERTVA